MQKIGVYLFFHHLSLSLALSLYFSLFFIKCVPLIVGRLFYDHHPWSVFLFYINNIFRLCQSQLHMPYYNTPYRNSNSVRKSKKSVNLSSPLPGFQPRTFGIPSYRATKWAVLLGSFALSLSFVRILFQNWKC